MRSCRICGKIDSKNCFPWVGAEVVREFVCFACHQWIYTRFRNMFQERKFFKMKKLFSGSVLGLGVLGLAGWLNASRPGAENGPVGEACEVVVILQETPSGTYIKHSLGIFTSLGACEARAEQAAQRGIWVPGRDPAVIKRLIPPSKFEGVLVKQAG